MCSVAQAWLNPPGASQDSLRPLSLGNDRHSLAYKCGGQALSWHPCKLCFTVTYILLLQGTW